MPQMITNATDFIYPCTPNVTSGFRPPNRPDHNGVDFSNGVNEPIYASAGGIVSKSYVSTTYGEVVFIKHNIGGQSYETVYAHMVTGSRLVQVNDNVNQGQKIGIMGTTGDSTGIHLHFELNIPEWVQGGANAVDPLPYLDGQQGGDLDLICENRYLSRGEMHDNAQYIANFFIDEGWTKNAIAGMLGNMEQESTMNACLWQNLDSGNTSLGFGLVQWTPATNLIDWANSNNLEPGSFDTQFQRLLYEKDNGLEWYRASDGFPTPYDETWEEWSKSTETPEYLASVFLKNYERAGVEAEETRKQNARYWYDTLDWTGGGHVDPKPPTYKAYLFNRQTNMRRMGVRGRR